MFKLFLFLSVFTLPVFAIDPTPGTGTYDPGLNCHNCSTSSNEEFINEYLNYTSRKKFGDYETENCNEYNNSQYDYYGCSDGSISFSQPDSEGFFEQEGMCGQVAMANMYHMYCKWNISVDSVDTHYANDYTPGSRASTMVNGLNEMFLPNLDCPSGSFRKY